MAASTVHVAAADSANTVAEIFKKMSYGPAPESDNVVKAWLDDHDKAFGLFIDGKWVKPEGRKTYATKNPATGEVLATTIQAEKQDVDLAVQSSKKAYASWSKLSPHVRARYMYSIARHIQKHMRLMSVLEAMDNGKTFRETKDADVPIVVRHFYHYAGWAQLADTEMKNWKSVGVVGAIVPWNFPLMLLTWKIAPALAMGNTVVLKPATYTRLSALLLAEICAEAGLPPGVFNVITGSGAMGSQLADHEDVDKVAFTGSTGVGQTLRRLVAGTGKKLSLELGGKSPVVVFESADLDSTVEGVVDAIWFNQGQVCSAGSRLLVQESILDKMVAKLKERLTHFRVGDSLDKGMDMGAIVDESQRRSIQEFVDSARKEGAEVFQIESSVPTNGCFYPPTIITNVQTVSRVVVEEIFGPVLVVLPFRTTKEAINLANNTIYGLAGSVWTENISLAMEVALSIKAGTIWINGHNLFDAAAGFGGYRQSGYGRDGGKEGLYEYARPSWEDRPRPPKISLDIKKFGLTVAQRPTIGEGQQSNIKVDGANVPGIDRTYKMYYGGAQKRPDAPYSRPVIGSDGKVVGHVGEGNRKDVRNAVEAAHAAFPGWGKRAAHNRAQITYFMAENLELRRDEVATRINQMTGRTMDDCRNEVDLSVKRLFHWGAYCDKYGGTVQETTLYGATVKVHEPVGVIGIACPEDYPLLGFVSLFAPAVVRGNTIIIIPSQKYPISALDLYQVFDTSDLPGGVVNILTGDRDHLSKYLTEHQDVQAMWYFGSAEGAAFVEYTSAENVKRTWVNYGLDRDWKDSEQGEGEEFLYHSVQCKNIWIPMGDTFAN
ncbi:aldehyde dehydrogenase family 16 member A1-like [Mizuhopecten yessoensis]|uniref:Aldehyde dehydrogenase family 16 member A1 n=1 Tax=Mizuhopecten yessoensis TaxID=6573 RepID=A0A210QFE6_MIZYE|nr:aldehyde dehydrogenase family 16 member A1-like [Mizuhopecten yessoensis]OWF47483.1 Aldehyde dehydrogenase family 16 member A1 [Mizuhopecten yessoensis]